MFVVFLEDFLKTECIIIDFSIKKGSSPMYWPNQEVVNYLIDQLADKKCVLVFKEKENINSTYTKCC